LFFLKLSLVVLKLQVDALRLAKKADTKTEKDSRHPAGTEKSNGLLATADGSILAAGGRAGGSGSAYQANNLPGGDPDRSILPETRLIQLDSSGDSESLASNSSDGSMTSPNYEHVGGWEKRIDKKLLFQCDSK
jgi:hypothetical protein